MQLKLVTENPQPATSFDVFWNTWPAGTKKARKYAMECWRRALKEGADPAEIVEGLRLYIKCKEPWREFMHPSTFLNKGCWTDEYEEAKDTTAAALEDGLARWREQNGHG